MFFFGLLKDSDTCETVTPAVHESQTLVVFQGLNTLFKTLHTHPMTLPNQHCGFTTLCSNANTQPSKLWTHTQNRADFSHRHTLLSALQPGVRHLCLMWRERRSTPQLFAQITVCTF